MHTKSPLYVLDQWDQMGGEKSKSISKSTKKTTKNATASLNTSNLLANGAAAAAQFINNFAQHSYEDDDEDSMLKGHCFI